MSIVDCQNYPKKGEKVKICKNCRHYREKEHWSKGQCAGYCLAEPTGKDFKWGYEVDGIKYMQASINGLCKKYEERKDDD